MDDSAPINIKPSLPLIIREQFSSEIEVVARNSHVCNQTNEFDANDNEEVDEIEFDESALKEVEKEEPVTTEF